MLKINSFCILKATLSRFALFAVGPHVAGFALVAYLVGQLAAGKEFVQIVYGGFGDILKRFPRQEALMGGKDNIGEGNKKGKNIVLDYGLGEILEEELALLLIYIQPRAANLSAFKRRQQLLAVYKLPS